MTTEYRQNTYDDDDMRAVIAELEKLEAKKTKVMATAAGECSKIAEKIKAKKKEARDELSIPLKVLNPILKRRKLERQISAITESVDEDFIEVFEDAAGQFCMFAVHSPEGDDEVEPEESETPAPARTKADDDAEQAEGEAVLEAVH